MGTASRCEPLPTGATSSYMEGSEGVLYSRGAGVLVVVASRRNVRHTKAQSMQVRTGFRVPRNWATQETSPAKRVAQRAKYDVRSAADPRRPH